MNSRAVVFGILGLIVGALAGGLVSRRMGSKATSPDTASATNVPFSVPQSSLRALRARSDSTNAAPATGRISIHDLPAEIERVMRGSTMERYHALYELANRVD